MAGQGTRPGWDRRCRYWDHSWLVGHDHTYTSARRAVPLACGLFVGWRRRSLHVRLAQVVPRSGATVSERANLRPPLEVQIICPKRLNLSRTPRFPRCEGRYLTIRKHTRSQTGGVGINTKSRANQVLAVDLCGFLRRVRHPYMPVWFRATESKSTSYAITPDLK